MNQKAVKWLYEQLPELVKKEIIPAESADLIQSYYGPVNKSFGNRTLLTMFGIVGVILIGLGITLILAHNWEQLSRMTRTFIVISKLLIAQILAGAIIWFKKDDALWTESTSTFLMIIIGSSIALIGQTYHIADDFSNFMLTWMLLSIPLVYLMKVTIPALLYLIGITTWAVSGDFGDINKHLIWVLLALNGPYYWKLIKVNPYANSPVLISWVLTPCFYICFGKVFSIQLQHLSMLIYVTLFAATYFIGLIWFDGPVKTWKKPFKAIGLTGCIGISFLLTSKQGWYYIGHGFNNIEKSEYLLLFSLLVLVIILSIILVSKKSLKNLLYGGVPIVAGVGLLLVYFDLSGINSTVLMNGYTLLLSVTLIRRGAREKSLGMLNIGMLMITILIIMRFFDSNFSFIVRGLTFVIIGSCFLVTNWIMVRRKKEVTP